jgi:predicted transcriptional regulator
MFMAAFNDIEAHLKGGLYGGRDGAPGFRRMLDEFKRKHARRLRQRQYDELILLSELRNTLTHGQRLNNYPLAEPTDAAVAAIRRLRNEILNPPLVLAILKRDKPVTASPDESVRRVLDVMYENNFSQVPVYERDVYQGLLTTNTVARWVADQMRRHEGLAEDAPARDALKFSERTDDVKHVARTVTTTEAIWRFTTAAESGQPLTALIITEHGSLHESPLGIVVAEDLARLSS